MEDRYKYEGTMICKRCGKRFEWYCINLGLLPRTKTPIVYGIPNGSLMAVNSYEADGTPVFKGGCTYCGYTNQLPKEMVLDIPEDIYKR